MSALKPPAQKSERSEPGIVVLLFTMAAYPAAAAFATVIAYIAQGDRLPALAHDYAFPIGAGAALLAWVASAPLLRRYVSARQANSRVYDELYQRFQQLDARLNVLCQDCSAQLPEPLRTSRRIACAEACAYREEIAAEFDSTGLRWAQATGYINLWNRIHRAEEALVAIELAPMVVAGALHDHFRLKDSTIDNRDQLLANLRRAALVVSPAAAQYFEPAGGTMPNDTVGHLASTVAVAAAGSDAEVEARAVLREVKRAINVFRDDRRDGLVRARNQLIGTGAFTGLTSYLLFGFATLVDVPWQAVGSMATFYLVGSMVGLFSRLGAEAETETAVEDYGLSRARLFHTPLFSGLAAVAGVVITVLLSIGLNTASPTPQPDVPTSPGAIAGTPAPAATTPAATDEPRARVGGEVSLVDIFDLKKNPLGLVVAGVFGLTPGLLIRRLQQQTEGYKADLRTSEAATR